MLDRLLVDFLSVHFSLFFFVLRSSFVFLSVFLSSLCVSLVSFSTLLLRFDWISVIILFAVMKLFLNELDNFVCYFLLYLF